MYSASTDGVGPGGRVERRADRFPYGRRWQKRLGAERGELRPSAFAAWVERERARDLLYSGPVSTGVLTSQDKKKRVRWAGTIVHNQRGEKAC